MIGHVTIRSGDAVELHSYAFAQSSLTARPQLRARLTTLAMLVCNTPVQV
jgi:hypothetical protein